MSKSIFSYEEICNIGAEFYEVFDGKDGIETNESYKLKKELEKYVINSLYTHDCVYNNCNLSFKDWCIKYKKI